MLLCLDIGNTHVLCGVFKQDVLIARFRYATHLMGTSDQFGIFLINILQTKNINPAQIKAISVCSVVPSYDYTYKHAISTYFESSKLFVLQAGVKTGLNIKYKNTNEIGADRIADAIAAIQAYPNSNIIIIGMGTATTVSAINKERDYLGGAILPGMRLSMESLKSSTAKLMAVEIKQPGTYIARSTRESIQSGLYYGQLGALKEIINGFNEEAFDGKKTIIIGTGGFAQLYKDQSIFDVILPDLVLQGLYLAFQYSLE